MTASPPAHAVPTMRSVGPSLLASIFAQVAATPAAAALRTATDEVDYATLRVGVQRAAAALRDAGVQPGDVVALPATRTPETITSPEIDYTETVTPAGTATR